MPRTFADDLAEYGPQAAAGWRPSLAMAREYCRQLTRRHYENFTVASWLLPAKLRPHFSSIYAYCRWADDLSDETAGGETSVALLDWWESQLDSCYRGTAHHPVFVALAETIGEFAIPPHPFRDLLTAFRQDQNRNRYETFNELQDYCRNSANPVGRLVLYLGRCHDERNGELADHVCTGLQLANFWQDVARDYDMGRVYLPREDCRRFGYTEAMLENREFNAAFRELLNFEVERAEEFLRRGEPLVMRVPPELRIDVQLFIDGGLAICQGIRDINFNVWKQRPEVSKWKKLKLLASAWWQAKWSTSRGDAAQAHGLQSVGLGLPPVSLNPILPATTTASPATTQEQRA